MNNVVKFLAWMLAAVLAALITRAAGDAGLPETLVWHIRGGFCVGTVVYLWPGLFGLRRAR